MSVALAGYEPGALGRVVELHGRYYARHWRFGRYFECVVARELAEFLARFDPARDGFWLAKDDGAIVGSVSLVGAHDAEPARLRWFVVEDASQGRGIGRRLLAAVMDFCRRTRQRHAYLTTFAGLEAARRLYEATGFTLTWEQTDQTWGVPVLEQRFDWKE
jgi:GNAT superfamily N-acetyltransferase